MSLYADYLREEEGRKIIETEKGFITYEVIVDDTSQSAKEMFINELFVHGDFRDQGFAKELVEAVSLEAKGKGLKEMTCYVWLDAKRPKYTTEKIGKFIHHGFMVVALTQNTIVMKKDLRGN